jgi:hypothetical protein
MALGPLVRLEGISVGQMPPSGNGVKPSTEISTTAKSSGGSGSTTAPTLKDFITNVLSEAVPFIDGVAPKDGSASTWKSKGSPKVYSSSEAPVYLYERRVAGADLDQIEGMSQFSADRKDETWFCRRSCHKDKSRIRTASWGEFKHAFKEHHSESEKAFTPTVIGQREAIRWDTAGIEVQVRGELWVNTLMVVEEMTHKIDPKPLKNRTFPVVQVAAELAGTDEFLVVSIPLTDFEKSPYSEYTRDKSLVVAAYASVERIRVIRNVGEVEWLMATASNAGGVLPQWVQNLAVPSAVAKDVDLFLSWIAMQRNSNGKTIQHSKSGSEKEALPSATAPPPISKNEDKATEASSIDKDLPIAPGKQSESDA